MQLNGNKLLFRPPKRTISPYLLMVWVIVVALAVTVIRGVDQGSIKPFFEPTPTPTRTTNSFAQEGEADFLAGDLDKAIAAYKDATRLDPSNVSLLAELARIETYSSELLTTDEEQRTRLQEAQDTIDQAEKLAPDDSTVRAIRSFVLDWNSNPLLRPDQNQTLLAEAEQEAIMAIQLDSTNTLALAFYGEILVDQQKLQRAETFLQQAMTQDSSLMDVHRIQGYYYENMGLYNEAIQEYQKASDIDPNLTFLYIQIGKIYRHLQLYPQALDLFAKAAQLDGQLGISDPIPYLAIANTYAETGEFFAAGRNVTKALQLDPTSPDVYGQLGIVYFKSRNYEGAIDPFQCAIYGCSADVSCAVRSCDSTTDPAITITGLPLSDSTVMYYYTYGSVLSGLYVAGSATTGDYCNRAMAVFKLVTAQYSADSTVMSIVQAGEDICTGP
jgi:tetratricopeptide (TPR) repeat protein